MSRLIGEAYISLLADASMFPADAKAKVDAALKGINGTVDLKGNTKDIDAKIAGIAASLKKLNGEVRIRADTTAFIRDIATAETAVLTLMDRLDNIPMDADSSKFMSKLFGAKSVVNDLAEQLENMDADGDMDKLISKIYGAKAVVEGLETEMSHLDADMDAAKMEAKLAALSSTVKGLADELDHMRADITDAALLAKITAAQAVVVKLAKSMRNMPMSADTLPLESDIYKAIAQVELLRKLASDVEIKPIVPSTLPGGGAKGTNPFEYGSFGMGGADASLTQYMDNLTMHTLSAMTAFKQFNTELAETAPRASLGAAALAMFARQTSMIVTSNVGGWWSFLNAKILTFGGIFGNIMPGLLSSVHVWHLLADGIFEFAAAWGPALIAATAFAAYAIPVGEKIYGQWKNINTILDGVGGKLTDLGPGFDAIEKAIEPSVLTAFGIWMGVVTKDSGSMADGLAKVGGVLDTWAVKFGNWADAGKKAFNNILNSGSGDLDAIGRAFESLGKIFGDFFRAMPGYVHILFQIGDAFLAGTAAILAWAEPLLKVALIIHGFIVYVGLAVTAVYALSRAMAGGAIASYLTKTTAGTYTAAAAAGEATSKFNKFGVAIGSFFGNLAAFGTNTARYTSNLFKLGDSAENVGIKTRVGAAGSRLLGDAIALVPMGAFGLAAAGAAAVIGVGLYLALKHTTDATVELGQKLQALIGGSNFSNIGKNITVAVAQTQKQLTLSLQSGTNAQQQYNKAVSNIPVNVSNAQAASVKNILKQQEQLNTAQSAGYAATQKSNPTGVYAQLTAIQRTAIGEAETYGQRMNTLTGIFGSNEGALQALNVVNVSAGEIAKEGNAAWAKQLTELQGLAQGYGYMSQTAGAAGAQLSTLNIVSGTTYKNVQALQQAESSWIGTITSGESAFTTFEQGFTNLSGALGKTAASAPAVSVTLGKLTERFTAMGAKMGGTSAASLAVRQAFDQQLTAGVGLYGNLQMLATASGNTAKQQGQLGKAGKDIIAQLLPFAAGSKQATAEVSSLAQIMGGPATTNFKTLAKWVGNTKGAEADLNTQQANLTITASNLTTAEKNLGNTLETSVTQAQAAAIAKTANLTGATQNLANAATEAKDKMTAQALLAAGQYVASLEKAGLSNNDATQYLNAYLGRLGYGQGVIKTMDGALDDNKSKFETLAEKMGLSKKAADNLFNSLQNLKNHSPYNPTVNDMISGSGGVVAKANIPGQPQLSARLNFSAAAHGLAAGGVVHGGIHGIDSVPAMLAPGELVVPASHAPAFSSMAKKAGIPGMAGGGVAGGAGQANQVNQIVPWTAGQGAKFATEATAAFASEVGKAAQNSLNQMASGAGGKYGGPSSFGGGFESLPALLAFARYFMANGLNAAAAAGMAATISGEENSLGPESVGTGGFGLIGWTGNTVGLPPGYHGPTGNVAFDLQQQLAGVIGYMNSRGGRGPLNAAGNPVAAGDVWSTYEAPAVRFSDTRPAIADEIYAALMGGSAAGAVSGSNTIAAHTAKRHSAGGMVSEPVYGTGAYSGMPYSFAENGQPEYVGPLSGNQGQGVGIQGATNIGQQQQTQQLATIAKLLQQLPTVLGKAISQGTGNGVRHGYYRATN